MRTNLLTTEKLQLQVILLKNLLLSVAKNTGLAEKSHRKGFLAVALRILVNRFGFHKIAYL